jgi:hypothetical protein
MASACIYRIRAVELTPTRTRQVGEITNSSDPQAEQASGVLNFASRHILNRSSSSVVQRPFWSGIAGYQLPVLGIEVQGSAGALASPFCRISIEMLSGDFTKAMRPSRGGRLMVTPCSISLRQVS